MVKMETFYNITAIYKVYDDKSKISQRIYLLKEKKYEYNYDRKSESS